MLFVINAVGRSLSAGVPTHTNRSQSMISVGMRQPRNNNTLNQSDFPSMKWATPPPKQLSSSVSLACCCESFHLFRLQPPILSCWLCVSRNHNSDKLADMSTRQTGGFSRLLFTFLLCARKWNNLAHHRFDHLIYGWQFFHLMTGDQISHGGS